MLATLFPPGPSARVCSSRHLPCQSESQLCPSPGMTLPHPSPPLCFLSPQVLSETWRFSNCACISPGLGKVSGSHPLPRLLILLQITGWIFWVFPGSLPHQLPHIWVFLSFFRCVRGILTLWSLYLQHWPLVWPLFSHQGASFQLRKGACERPPSHNCPARNTCCLLPPYAKQKTLEWSYPVMRHGIGLWTNGLNFPAGTWVYTHTHMRHIFPTYLLQTSDFLKCT